MIGVNNKHLVWVGGGKPFDIQFQGTFTRSRGKKIKVVWKDGAVHTVIRQARHVMVWLVFSPRYFQPTSVQYPGSREYLS